MMNASGTKTRNAILDAASSVFMEKGFAAATMSDFCKACRLSRGGLYRHFTSTGAIFEAMLRRDKDDWQSQMDKAMADAVPAQAMLKAYLAQTLDGIKKGGGQLSLAAYEYVRADPARVAFAKERHQAALKLAALLLSYGVSRGEFRPCDIEVAAGRFVVLIDGLRLASLFVLSEDAVRAQLDGFYQTIVKEEIK